MNERQLMDVARLIRKGEQLDRCDAETTEWLIQQIESDAIALRAYRILARREARIEEACGRRPVNEALLIVEANALAVEDPTLAEGL